MRKGHLLSLFVFIKVLEILTMVIRHEKRNKRDIKSKSDPKKERSHIVPICR
jgi:hypothetical protein